MSSTNGIDYGPLAGLLGSWEGDKGLDVAPGREGSEESLYTETLVFTAIGDVTNADSQTLAVLRYQQIVQRKVNGEVFHDQTGYWMWDAREGVVMQSVVIPRAVCVLAGGRHAVPKGQATLVQLSVAAALDDPDWGIVQSPFMRDQARTLRFQHELMIEAGTLRYSETTVLEIYGRSFEHTDANELVRRSHRS